MRIAFILPSLLNRGPIVFTRYLVNALIDFGVDVEIFYVKPQKEIEFICKCHQLNFFSSAQLRDFDIVHTTMLRPDIFGWLHRKCLGDRWVISMHNEIGADLKFTYPKYKAFILTALWLAVLKSSKNIITSSEAQLAYYRKLLGAEKNFRVIGYGIEERKPMPLNPSEAEKLENLRRNFKIVGACGLLIKRKGFEQLISVLTEIKKIAVVIIGDGELKGELLARAESLGVADRFLILGFKSNHLDYYPYFDAYALTSYSEGFGLAMIEAMSLSIPVVCSDLDIYRDYFDSNDVGLFVPGDISGLASAIDRVLSGSVEYSRRSGDLFREVFSSMVMARHHIEFYKDVINNEVSVSCDGDPPVE